MNFDKKIIKITQTKKNAKVCATKLVAKAASSADVHIDKTATAAFAASDFTKFFTYSSDVDCPISSCGLKKKDCETSLVDNTYPKLKNSNEAGAAVTLAKYKVEAKKNVAGLSEVCAYCIMKQTGKDDVTKTHVFSLNILDCTSALTDVSPAISTSLTTDYVFGGKGATIVKSLASVWTHDTQKGKCGFVLYGVKLMKSGCTEALSQDSAISFKDETTYGIVMKNGVKTG